MGGRRITTRYNLLGFPERFDKVGLPYQGLLLKLKSHGMGIIIINWIEQSMAYRQETKCSSALTCQQLLDAEHGPASYAHRRLTRHWSTRMRSGP